MNACDNCGTDRDVATLLYKNTRHIALDLCMVCIGEILNKAKARLEEHAEYIRQEFGDTHWEDPT